MVLKVICCRGTWKCLYARKGSKTKMITYFVESVSGYGHSPKAFRLFIELHCNKGFIDQCFTPLSTMFQLYHGISWVSYQYYWSIYPDTSQSVTMLTPQPWAPRKAAITTILKVFGMTQSGIKPVTSCNPSTTRPWRWSAKKKDSDQTVGGVIWSWISLEVMSWFRL